MKLRIRGDSIRLRLKRGEVDQLAAGKSIVEETHFPGSVLTYRLDVSEKDTITVNYKHDNLVVTLPASKVADWANTDEVSLTATQSLSDDATLTVLIEKDFACLDPGHGRDHEDDVDSFPHPSAASAASE